MASEHSNSEAFRDFIRIQPGGHERADLHAEMPPGIVVVALENIADEYEKEDKDADDMLEGFRSRGVQQVPLALTIKGPISLRRGGKFDEASEWSQDPYKVTIGKQGSS